MSALDEYKQFSVLLRASAFATGATDGLATMVRADAAIIELEAELVELRDRRCHNCKFWDYELAETVAEVSFAFCENSMAYKEFSSRVVSEGWLCPCWVKRKVL